MNKRKDFYLMPSPDIKTEWMEPTYMKLELGRWGAQREEGEETRRGRGGVVVEEEKGRGKQTQG